MKRVTLKYNPYLITTEFTIEGKTPKTDSLLNVGHSRIQEWADMLPEWLQKEYNDNEFNIEFTGIPGDLEDLKQGFANAPVNVQTNFTYVRKPDVDEAEKAIDAIFQEIKSSPIKELTSSEIIKAFYKAKGSRFEVNVVACMGSGKSTLINALLGKQLMPAAQEATTATIVKIADKDVDRDTAFIAKAFNDDGIRTFGPEEVDLAKMQKINANDNVSLVEMEGPIPFVDTAGMRLVLVDTPGPNNARNKHHEEMTYKMMSDSDKSLVLFVLNAAQSGITDESVFLDYVCKCMKNGGKQTKDRFIFVVNKINMFDPRPEYDKPGCVKRTLNTIKMDLEERGIQNPNIFPVAALPALEKRIKDRRETTLHSFRNSVMDYEEMQFDKYYNFSHLPKSSQHFIESAKNASSGDDLVEIQTGICNLEEAIRLYVNKYARTTKIMDLVLSFNSKLHELATTANIEDKLRKDENAKKELEKQIAIIRENIKTADDAKKYSDIIDGFDVKPMIEKDLDEIISEAVEKVNSLNNGIGNKVELADAEKQFENIKKTVSTCEAQVKAQIESSLDKHFKKALSKVIDDYQKYLDELNVNTDNKLFDISPIETIKIQLYGVDSIIKQKSFVEKESRKEKKTKYMSKQESSIIGGIAGASLASCLFFWAGPAAFFATLAVGGIAGGVYGHRNPNTTTEVDVQKDITYVKLDEVVSDYLRSVNEELNKLKKSVTDYVDNQTVSVKKAIESTLNQINDTLNKKLDSLSKMKNLKKAKTTEIAEKEKQLAWLKNIEQRINDVVNF